MTNEAQLFQVLARWSLAQVCLALALLIVFLGFVGIDPTVPAERDN